MFPTMVSTRSQRRERSPSSFPLHTQINSGSVIATFAISTIGPQSCSAELSVDAAVPKGATGASQTTGLLGTKTK